MLLNGMECYPRPQLVRSSFMSLDGEWEFALAAQGEQPRYTRVIRVPYCMECPLSGIGERHRKGDILYYRRSFRPDWEKLGKDGRIILHCGALDQRADLYVNGVLYGRELRFPQTEADITALCRKEEENSLVLAVKDDGEDVSYPYGKQKEKNGGMWYTPVSGIWGSVWLENVPDEYIRFLDTELSAEEATITAVGCKRDGELVLDTGERFPVRNGTVTVRPRKKHLWSPEDPYLYHYTLTLGEDSVRSYFALRSFEIQNVNGVPRLCLNGRPYFINAVLSQGYFADGLWTPGDLNAYEKDILFLKECGFNAVRKHIKTEPDRFYYDCDRLGLLVMQDSVNSGKYSFLRDTALPTLGLKHWPERRLKKEDTRRKRFEEDLRFYVPRLSSHPCVCLWTVFNEGWGQFSAKEEYTLIKTLRPRMTVDTASGWFVTKHTDVLSEHVYFRPFRMKKRLSGEKPLLLTEFGGYALKVQGHCFRDDGKYGYRFFSDAESFAVALTDLYEKQILPAARNGLSGCAYTQLSDVEDEVNGLLTYDRKVRKIAPERLRAVFERIRAAADGAGER